LQTWDEWQAESAVVATTSALPSVISATHIAHPVSEIGEAILAEYRWSGVLFPKTSTEAVAPATGSTESGAELGVALHALLEMVPLDAPMDEDFEEKASAAGNLAGLQDLDRFVSLARSVFRSPPVVRAAAREHWREMPLAGTSPAGTLVVEGIADLVYREDDGSLVIVDYKTDVGVSAETLEAYWTQLSIYADLLHGATGESADRVLLVFARPDDAKSLERVRST
jgi:ATP-dependent helicase/nuclease subunit A